MEAESTVNHKKVSGCRKRSVCVAVIISSVLSILVVLGWAFWWNFIYEATPSVSNDVKITQKEEVAEQESGAKEDSVVQYKTFRHTYKNETFSFQYPEIGWREDHESGDQYDFWGGIVTDDYVEPVALTPESGASITINIKTKDNITSFRKPVEQDAAGISNIQTLEVDGRTAYFHRIEYEGIRYNVNLQSDTLDYVITLQAAGDATRAQKDVFNQVWKTFDIE